jgi:hypothetical protein
MKKLLMVIVLATLVGFTSRSLQTSGLDSRWLDAASRMVRRGETVRTPSRARVNLLVQWARQNHVSIALTLPVVDGGSSYAIVAR